MPFRMRRWSPFGRPVRGFSGGRCGCRRRHCASVKSPRLTPPMWHHTPATEAVCRSALAGLTAPTRRHAVVVLVTDALLAQPHHLRTFKRSNDPASAEKVEAIVGLYTDPPMHTVVLSIDEK